MVIEVLIEVKLTPSPSGLMSGFSGVCLPLMYGRDKYCALSIPSSSSHAWVKRVTVVLGTRE